MGVCTNQHDHDRRNYNINETNNHDDYQHNLRGRYGNYL